MDQFMSLLCTCVKKVMEDADQDGIPDIMQKVDGFSDKGDSLNDALSRNLLSLRGRRKMIQRDITIEILPTKFEDEDEPASEDEDGEEVSVFQETGFFAGQHYEHIRSKCLDTNQLFVDPMFPPCQSSLYISKDLFLSP